MWTWKIEMAQPLLTKSQITRILSLRDKVYFDKKEVVLDKWQIQKPCITSFLKQKKNN